MRFRVSFEVRLDRDKPEEPEPEPHPRGDNYATAERADPAPIGFNIGMPDHAG